MKWNINELRHELDLADIKKNPRSEVTAALSVQLHKWENCESWSEEKASSLSFPVGTRSPSAATLRNPWDPPARQH